MEAILGCLNPVYREYAKNESIFRQGESISGIGMVLSGRVHIVEEDFWGNRSILSDIGEGQVFGETYACVQGEILRVSVYAMEQSTVMFLDVARVFSTCSSACRFHAQLIRNLLFEYAQKNLLLTRKLSHMSKRSTRDKLLSYLSDQSLEHGSSVFDIPFNRQQLADYLSVDRSAMSSELGRLRDEGVLDFDRNHFKLIKDYPVN